MCCRRAIEVIALVCGAMRVIVKPVSEACAVSSVPSWNEMRQEARVTAVGWRMEVCMCAVLLVGGGWRSVYGW